MSGSAAEQLSRLISDLETDLGVGANAPVVSAAAAAAAAAPAADAPAPKKKGEGKAKKEKAPKPAKKAAAAADPDQPEITKLDIRVGQIVKVWKHETADKYAPSLSVVRPA